MAKCVIISCVKGKKKNPGMLPAKERYDSAYFDKMYKYGEMYGEETFILSAEYGFLKPTEPIEYYQKTLYDLTKAEKQEWANDVWNDMKRCIDVYDEVDIIAGKPYYKFLINRIEDLGLSVNIPYEGMRFGPTQSALKEDIQE